MKLKQDIRDNVKQLSELGLGKPIISAIKAKLQDKDNNSKYAKLFLDYTYGLNRIYDRAFIEKKKLEPEFEREYNLKYLGKIGNVFNSLQIDKAIEQFKGLPINGYCQSEYE